MYLPELSVKQTVLESSSTNSIFEFLLQSSEQVLALVELDCEQDPDPRVYGEGSDSVLCPQERVGHRPHGLPGLGAAGAAHAVSAAESTSLCCDGDSGWERGHKLV